MDKPTKHQAHWLKELAIKRSLTVQYDKPPMRVMNALAAKGLCKNIMDTFFEITPAGDEWVNKQESRREETNV